MATLEGRQILVAEDEFMLAADLADEVESRGATVIGPTASVAEGLALLEARAVDAAILDVNLRGEMVFGLADALLGRAVPFIFATGYDAQGIPPRFAGVTRCSKPCEPRDVVNALQQAMQANR